MSFGLVVYREDERTCAVMTCPVDVALSLVEALRCNAVIRRLGLEMDCYFDKKEAVVRHLDCSPEELAVMMEQATAAGILTHRIGLNVH